MLILYIHVHFMSFNKLIFQSKKRVEKQLSKTKLIYKIQCKKNAKTYFG